MTETQRMWRKVDSRVLVLGSAVEAARPHTVPLTTHAHHYFSLSDVATLRSSGPCARLYSYTLCIQHISLPCLAAVIPAPNTTTTTATTHEPLTTTITTHEQTTTTATHTEIETTATQKPPPAALAHDDEANAIALPQLTQTTHTTTVDALTRPPNRGEVAETARRRRASTTH